MVVLSPLVSAVGLAQNSTVKGALIAKEASQGMRTRFPAMSGKLAAESSLPVKAPAVGWVAPFI
jgi:hypothetical protein